MNDTLQPTTERIFRRLDEPIRIFGNDAAPYWDWWVIVGVVLFIGAIYIARMYMKDSKAMGIGWAVALGLSRTCVYLLLAWVFMLPAQQTWYTIRQTSRVVVMLDTSLSIAGTRDDTPPENSNMKFTDMPTRQDKVI